VKPSIALDEIMASNSASVDPSRFPNEGFDLYSIPAFDSRQPEVVLGRNIGSAKQVVQPGDVLLSRIVPHIRRAWVVGEDRGRRLIASGEWIVFRSTRVHSTYLRYLLVEDQFYAQFMNTVAGVGGSLLRARPAQVADIEIPLPSLSEQQRIADILEQADRLRHIRRYALELDDSLLPAAFLQLFGDPREPESRWSIAELGELGALDRGRSRNRPRNAPFLYGGKYPFIQTGDVANSNGYIRAHTQSYSEEGLRQSKLWPAETLCITIAANIAKTAILTYPACFPDSIVGFIPGKHVKVEYVQFWLGFLQELLERTAPEAAQKNINLEILRGLKFPVPPLSLQNQFAALVERSERLRQVHREALRQAEHLFKTVLHRAFTTGL
jgi:type I restriction enzyme S subunit